MPPRARRRPYTASARSANCSTPLAVAGAPAGGAYPAARTNFLPPCPLLRCCCLARPARRCLSPHPRHAAPLAQVVCKTRLALSPLLNQWWQATFCVTPRGLSTGTVLCAGGSFEVLFDFRAYRLRLFTSAGAPVQPATAASSTEMGKFLLPYEAVRTAPDPRIAVLDFCQNTY
ncbi:DUF5996 family protein [Hymenobacter nivis]|uniref:DUF5996 family protein n=1 Tax=Hymenobacter nivis TaxID=1850093 RepID=UPI001B86323B|nr:DUF5996 family protein [Hymenobacter nivis]